MIFLQPEDESHSLATHVGGSFQTVGVYKVCFTTIRSTLNVGLHFVIYNLQVLDG